MAGLYGRNDDRLKAALADLLAAALGAGFGCRLGDRMASRRGREQLGRKYSITPSELLELKGRAAKLFSAPPGGHPVAEPAAKTGAKRGRK